MENSNLKATIDNQVLILPTKKSLRQTVNQWRKNGETVALIPTMGALHGGHLSLVGTAEKHCDRTIVSIFVNPTQFGPGEDFKQYPRNEVADIELLKKIGADAVYMPSVTEMYGPAYDEKNFFTSVKVKGITELMEGAIRSTHFDGVALVVSKLLLQCLPDIAVFGEKDYQQLQVVKRLVADLNIPVNIIASPLIRQPDGVAMSSRNAYLSEKQKKTAPWIYKTLCAVSEKLRANPHDVEQSLKWGVDELYAKKFDTVDYLELRDPETLRPLPSMETGTGRLLVTARLGGVRLLDNIEVIA